MAFCKQCGSPIPEGNMFCTVCGTKVDPQPNAQENNQPAAYTAPPQGQSYAPNTNNVNEGFDPNDIAQSKGMAVLAYFSLLVLIPIFAAKQSKFARFHANQGLVLLIVEVVWWVAELLIPSVFRVISFWLGSFVAAVLGLVNIAFLVFAIIGIVNAANGNAKELPLIGKIRILN